MFTGIIKEQQEYSRPSKLGLVHVYKREKSYAVFLCDSCGDRFIRLKGSIDPKRLNNNYFHCCSRCDAKRFAQKKGAERRTIWDMPVNSDLDISKL